jgi:hypothetical protein
MRSATAALVLAALLAAPARGASLESAAEIEACARDLLRSDTCVQTLRFRTRDRAGNQRELRARLYWRRGEDGRSNVLLRVTEPPEVRGAGLLLVEKAERLDLFSYAPELKRVRRVTSRMLSTSVFGTDFSLEELERLHGMAKQGESARLPDAAVEERPVYVVESRPAPAAGSAYDRVVSYVDRETCVPLRVEYFQRAGQPRKVLAVDPSRVERAGESRVPRRLEMRDLLAETATTLEVEALELGVPLSRSLFSARTLEAGSE